MHFDYEFFFFQEDLERQGYSFKENSYKWLS